MAYYIAIAVTAVVGIIIFAHEQAFKVLAWTLKTARNSIFYVLKHTKKP